MARPSAYWDFDVAVERDGDQLDVRVLRSPAGETGAVHGPLPTAAAGNGAAASGRADPLRDAGPAGTAPGAGTEPGAARDTGAALFTALFSGDVLTRFRESRRRAETAGYGLRLVLRFGDGADTLPWELLWDPEHRLFLGLDPAVPIVRCIEMPARAPAPPMTGPLRVLVAISTPADAGPLAAGLERTLIERELEPVRAGGALEIEVLENASLDAIRARVAAAPVHVFHYIGHGDVLDDGTSGFLLTGADGARSTRRAEELAAVLASPTLRLAVLNSCHGSPADDADPFAGAATTFVKAGVPAVIAMRRSISDRAAIAFAAELYDALTAGARIEAAVASGRAALFAADGAISREWPTVALHLGSSLDADLTASPLPPLDEDVQFTVSRPSQLRATRWEPMLVFAHRAEPYEGAHGETVDPRAEVDQRIAGFFGPELAQVTTTTDEARGALPRGAQLVVVPDLPDVQCEPPRAPLTWTGEIAETRFLLRAASSRVGTTVRGWVRVFCGPLVIAETAIEAPVVADGVSTPAAPPADTTVPRYRRIFPCFSPEDAELVTGVAAVAEALGDQYASDVIEARRDQAPDEWMLPRIAEADVFQLFWSSHSMNSASCRLQWETALGLGKQEFIRPLYWEEPFPRADGLPPSGLAALRFVRVPGPTPTTTDTLWAGAPSGRAVAPPAAEHPGGRTIAPTPAPPPAPAPGPLPVPSGPTSVVPPPGAGEDVAAASPDVEDMDDVVAAPGPPPVFAPPPPPRRRSRRSRRSSTTSWWAVPAMAAVIAIAAAGVVVTNLGQTADDDASPVETTASGGEATEPDDTPGFDTSPPTSAISPTTSAAPPTAPSTAPVASDDGEGRAVVSVLAGLIAIAAAAVAVVSLRRRRPG